MTTQKGDKANKLKGDTKRKERQAQLLFVSSLISTKTIILNEIMHGDKSKAHIAAKFSVSFTVGLREVYTALMS